MSDAPARTHNLPDLVSALDLVPHLIDHEIGPLKARADELVDSGKRFLAAYPTIESDEADSKASEVLAVCARFAGKTGRVELARIALKAPILKADNAIGSLAKGPFAKVIEPVNAIMQQISRLSIAYKQKVEREAREAAQAEARRKAEEAQLAEELASKGSRTVSFDDAANAAQAAEDAQKIAESSAADLTRAHGDGIGVSSLRYKRVVTVIEPDKVPRMYCVPDLAALTRAAGKAGTPFPKIDGVSISDSPDLTIRK